MPAQIPIANGRNSLRHSGQSAMALREARIAAKWPTHHHNAALAKIATKYLPAPETAGIPVSGSTGRPAFKNKKPTTPKREPGRAIKIAPKIARIAANTTATMPPRWRTESRWAMMPWGTMRAERVEVTIQRSYEVGIAFERQVISDRLVIAAAALTFCATRFWWALNNSFWPAAVLIDCRQVAVLVAAIMLVLAVNARRLGVLVVLGSVGLAILGSSGATYSWGHAEPRNIGAYSGIAIIRSDPEPYRVLQRVVLEIDGERFETYASGLPGSRLRQRLMGESVFVSGTRAGMRVEKIKWMAPRHVVGSFTVSAVSEQFSYGAPLYRSANRIRRALSRTAATMPSSDAALFLGLIIGDDREQPTAMRDAFRAAGLSHLVAVSGQNVAFVLVVVSPLLRRLRTWWQFIATLGTLSWFVVLTRIEPSVLRAVTMAGLAAFGFARGRELSPLRILSFAIIGLLVIDPMLAWSIGFAMSVGATAGLVVLTPQLAMLFKRRGLRKWCIQPLATTLGAQLGVMPISAFVFHNAPVLGIIANLLAVPIAGLIMLVGLPIGLLSAALPLPLVRVAMLPMLLAVRWVWWVAVVAQRAAPGQWLNIGGWLALLLLAATWLRRYPLDSTDMSK